LSNSVAAAANTAYCRYHRTMSGWPDEQDFEDVLSPTPPKKKKEDDDDSSSSGTESEDEMEKARNRAKRASLVEAAEKILSDQGAMYSC
jgi:hypothetical protein